MLAPAVFSHSAFYSSVASCVSIHTERTPYFLFPGDQFHESCYQHKMLAGSLFQLVFLH